VTSDSPIALRHNGAINLGIEKIGQVPANTGPTPWRHAARLLVLASLLLSLDRPVLAQEQPAPLAQQVRDGLLSSFAVPVEELFEKKHPSEWRNLLSGLSGAVGTTVPLSRPDFPKTNNGRLQGTQQAGSPTLDLRLRYQPLSYWFFATSLHRYLDRDDQAPWNPDFTYSFGYDDWHPYTLSLVYGNYGNNRFDPNGDDNEQFTRFSQGTWSLAWKFPVPEVVAEPLLIDTSQKINCRISGNLTPSYFDNRLERRRSYKKSASFGCRYPIWKSFFFDWNLYYYPDGRQQQPWDPDFTYGFGYFDWRPGTITVQYSNYAGNRYPWRDHTSSAGQFTDGQITLGLSFAF
jgi:hypothetical protein